MKRLVLALLVLLCGTAAARGQLASFPGAQGGGAASVGGRGGSVIEITNNNDSGAGSYRACVAASGPRTCIFRVAGLFPITSGDVTANNAFLTIDGQSAPGEVIIGGPNTNGAILRISTHDVIVRYVTLSPDNPNQSSGPDSGTTGIFIANCSSIWGPLPPAPPTTTGCYNIIFDHVTTRWSGNKSFITTSNFTPTAGSGTPGTPCSGSPSCGVGPNHSITVQWTLDYEPHEGHPVGYGTATDEACQSLASHGGCLSSYETNIDFHHDVLVNVDHRIPEIGNKSSRWISDIIYNWGTYAMQELGAMSLDIINSKYIQGNLNSLGPAQAHPTHWTANGPEICGPPSGYMSGNIFGPAGTNTVNPNQWGTLAIAIAGENATAENSVLNPANEWCLSPTGGNQPQTSGVPVPIAWQRSSPMAASNSFPITPDPATNLDTLLLPTIGNSQHLDCLGNFQPHRDAADKRVIAQYQAGGPGGYWPNGVTYNGVIYCPPATSGCNAPPGSSPPFPVPTVQSAYTDIPIINGTVCVESLHDGIPDQWKVSKGLSTTDPNLHNAVGPDGYTYLEEYLNGVGGPPPVVPPNAPTTLAASVSGASVVLTWTASSSANVAGYNVYRGTVSGGPYAPVASGVAATTYTDTPSVPGTYFYVVTAFFGGVVTGVSGNGTTATVTCAAVCTFQSGAIAVIQGDSVPSFNGTFTVASQPSPTTFTFASTTTGSGTGGAAWQSGAESAKSNQAQGNTSVTLTATLLPSSLNFPSTLIGTSSTSQTVTLTNTSPAGNTIAISAITLSGANATDYSNTTTCGSALNSGSSCTVSITFTPTAAGTRSATLSVTDTAASSPQTVALTGVGNSPVTTATLSPSALVFGAQLVGTSSTAAAITLTNTGTGTLNIASISIIGSGFTQTNTCGASLPPINNCTCTINVVFSPMSMGTVSAVLQVSDNAASSPQTVALTGTGINTKVAITPQVTITGRVSF